MLNREDRKYIFLGKLDNNDRDCCVYLDRDNMDFDCDHYFGCINISGACFSRGIEDIENEDIKTILSKKDIDKLIYIDRERAELGFGVKENSDEYRKGLQLQIEYQEILDKLLTDEAEKFFQEIIQEEKECCMQEYNLEQEEIDWIFEVYCYDYQDRAVIMCIYEDLEDMAREWIDNCYDIDENYYMLSDGRIIQYSL